MSICRDLWGKLRFQSSMSYEKFKIFHTVTFFQVRTRIQKLFSHTSKNSLTLEGTGIIDKVARSVFRQEI